MTHMTEARRRWRDAYRMARRTARSAPRHEFPWIAAAMPRPLPAAAFAAVHERHPSASSGYPSVTTKYRLRVAEGARPETAKWQYWLRSKYALRHRPRLPA